MGAKKHIVFDWNCTLLDDFHALLAAVNKMLESEGHRPITADAFRAHYDIPFGRLYGNLGLKPVDIEKLLRTENNAFHDHYEPMADLAGLREGAAEILGHVRASGVHALILSNHIVDPIRAQLRRLKIEDHFLDVLAYADRATQGLHMTKGEKLQRFMREQGMKPGDTIIIGDTVEEPRIAREQGLIGVAITGGCVSEERLRAEKPDYVIHSLHELKPILQERGFA